ncbi:MAG: hypothetical protein AAF713_12255 [Pseudomonadota bacterium]
MSKLLRISSVFALAAGMAVAATDVKLPVQVSSVLETAGGAADVAALMVDNPRYATAILSEANLLGIAAPCSVLGEAVTVSTGTDTISRLVFAAAQAAPDDADICAAAAYDAANGNERPGLSAVIGAAAVNGTEATLMTDEQVAVEAAEIAAALRVLSVDRDTLISSAIAAATDGDADTETTVLDDANALEGGDIVTGDATEERFGGSFSFDGFVTIPSEAQNNPSGN